MRELYKLAVAFEKASQVSIEPNYSANPNLTPDPRPKPTKEPFSHTVDIYKKPMNLDGLKAPKYNKIDPWIQLSLKNLGYPGSLQTDGILGGETKVALDWFKKEFGLTPTTSPDIVYTQIKNEIAKLDKSSNAEMASPASKSKSLDLTDLNQTQRDVGGPKV